MSNPRTAPVHPWEFPPNPWERLHIDYAGPFRGHMYLIAVDAHSKWPGVIPMSSTSSPATANALRSLFARIGLPKQIVSDNGPQFVSEDFEHFLKCNGIKHIKSSPYHPRSNGLAKRFVQSFKSAMKKEETPISQRLSVFLLRYRNTQRPTTEESPVKLMFGRNLRTRLDLLRPAMHLRVSQEQSRMTLSSHTGKAVREFDTGETVMVRDYRERKKPWMHATIQRKTGPLSYKVKTNEGAIWPRHIDQIRNTATNEEPFDKYIVVPPVEEQKQTTHEDVVQRDNPVEQPHIDTPPPITERTPTTESRSVVNQRRYPRFYKQNNHTV